MLGLTHRGLGNVTENHYNPRPLSVVRLHLHSESSPINLEKVQMMMVRNSGYS